MKKDLIIETVNGIEMVRIFSKTKNGKPLPDNKTYSFLVPLVEYNSNYKSKPRTRTM